ncbi:MAG: methyltransferase domain-containing protein [Bacteroidota bacterium]
MDSVDKNKIAVDAFDHAAEGYAEKFMDQSLYQDSFDQFCEALPFPHARILDIACGPGNISKYLLARLPKLQLLGIDLAPRMIELAKAHNAEAEFMVWDSREIKALGRKFEGIMCGFCLPYLNKEEALDMLAQSADILTENGILFLSTMEGRYEDSGWEGPSSGEGPKIFMHYYESAYLVAALEQLGFEILLQQRQDFDKYEHKKFTDLILIARKN